MIASTATVLGRVGLLALLALAGFVAVRALNRDRSSKAERAASPTDLETKAAAARDLGLEGGGWLLFTSTTCSPCRRVKSELEASAATWAEADIDESPDLFKLWHVYRVPTLIWIDGSGETHERHGPASAREAISSS